MPKKDNIISKKKEQTFIDFEKQTNHKRKVKEALEKISKLKEKVCRNTKGYNRNPSKSLKTNAITSGLKKVERQLLIDLHTSY